MIVMFDTITVATVPSIASSSQEAVAGYVDGSWPDYQALVRRFPNAHHLSIAPFFRDDADCGDFEQGDMRLGQAAAWNRRQHARGKRRPADYTSVSNVDELVALLRADGQHDEDFLIWSAHYGHGPHICGPTTCGQCRYPNVAGTQWTDVALGRNLDESLLHDWFFGPPPAPVDPHHYDWYPANTIQIGARRLNERLVAQTYDKLRGRPALHRRELARLRDASAQLAGRILTVAYENADQHGNPQLDVHRRRWRFWQLTARAQGQRLS